MVELILAAFIIGFGFLAVARILPSTTRAIQVDKERLLALRIARNIMDDVRSRRPFPRPAPATIQQAYDPNDPTNPGRALAGESIEGKAIGLEFALTNLTLQVTPTLAGSATNASVANITVTVQWRAGSDKMGNVDTSTANYGAKNLTLTGGWTREP